MLAVSQTRVERPAYPVVDVHNHLGRAGSTRSILAQMDRAGVRTVVNLDGTSGASLETDLARFDRAHPGRFLTFAQIDFAGIDDAQWSARTAKQLEKAAKRAA
jgi:hypothetical protein